MPLKDRSRIPPGGWRYQEETTGWPLPVKVQDLPFKNVVETILAYRENNWKYNLSADFAEVARALEEQTCERLPNLCIGDRRMIEAEMIRREQEWTGGNCPGCGLKRIR